MLIKYIFNYLQALADRTIPCPQVDGIEDKGEWERSKINDQTVFETEICGRKLKTFGCANDAGIVQWSRTSVFN